MDQFGYWFGDNEGKKPGAGVLGGETLRSDPPSGVKGISSISLSCEIGDMVSANSSSSTRGSSMLGMGISATTTDARNC